MACPALLIRVMPDYEIEIDGAVGPVVQSCLPGFRAVAAPVVTVLAGTVAGQADVAALLQKLSTLGLAPIVVEQVLATCARIRDSGRTVLMVEQNAELALEVADRAYVLERGHVVTEGSAAEIASSPRIQQAYLAG